MIARWSGAMKANSGGNIDVRRVVREVERWRVSHGARATVSEGDVWRECS